MSLFWILVSAGVAFLATFVTVPYFQRFFHNLGVTGIDQQKLGKPRLPSAGGIPVAFGSFLGLMVFVAINTFIDHSPIRLSFLLAAALASFAIALVGFFDDLYVNKTITLNASAAREYRVGLKQWMKPLLTLVAAVPLMAVEAGNTTLNLPFFGPLQFGILYPLLLIPIAVVCVSNATNMLAGFNGLESGMLSIATAGVGMWALLYGNSEGAAVAFVGVGALLAFWAFNRPPASFLPGDSLTYFGGAVFVSAVVLGNVTRFGIVVFLPWIIEAFLKLRGRFNVRSYGNLRKNGTIAAPYQKIYSLPHALIKLCERAGMQLSEKRIVYSMLVLEMLLVIAATFVGRG